VESAVAWQKAIEHQGATCLLFSRQNLPFLNRTPEVTANIARGGYVLMDCVGTPEIILMATGSEVSLALLAAKELHNVKVRVVSIPSMDVFLAEDRAYQESVLPSNVSARMAIEAGSSESWYKLVGLQGKIIGLDHFGASAPAPVIFEAYGFSVPHLVRAAYSLLKEEKSYDNSCCN
jgi:transketolase